MKKKIILKGKVEIKAEDNKITVIASDETLDRHGDVLPIDQWDLTKFLTAPRMLVDHNHEVSSIVGKWNNVRIEGKKMLMDADFHGITELSKAVQQMVEQGYLNTVSVGFIYNGPKNDGDRPTFELIETSWVTVPANPSARVVKDAMSKGLSDDEKAKLTNFVGKTDDEEATDPEDFEADDVEVIEPAEPTDEPDEIGSPARPVSTDDEAKAFNIEGKTSVCISVVLFEKFVKDSEKLRTLTDAELAKVGADKAAKLLTIAFKEAAHIVNDSLLKLNKQAKVK